MKTPGYLQPLPVIGPFVRLYLDFTISPRNSSSQSVYFARNMPFHKVRNSITHAQCHSHQRRKVFGWAGRPKARYDAWAFDWPRFPFYGPSVTANYPAFGGKTLIYFSASSSVWYASGKSHSNFFQIISHHLTEKQKNWNLLVPFDAWYERNETRNDRVHCFWVGWQKSVGFLDVASSFEG